MFPKSGAPMETDTHFQSLSISFGVPSKGTLPPSRFPSHSSLGEKEMLNR
jgi:hypothetical protein